LQHNPEQKSRFFGVLSHSVRVEDFFAPENVKKIMDGAGKVATAG
jgi:hypothetical protein